MNRSFFSKTKYYNDWGRFKKTGSHTRTKSTPNLPPPKGKRGGGGDKRLDFDPEVQLRLYIWELFVKSCCNRL